MLTQKNDKLYVTFKRHGVAGEIVYAKLKRGSRALYSMLAENIDGSCGAVVADQTHLASLLGVGRQTISRYVKWLEEQGVLVKIPVAGKVCAMLNPHEV